MVRGRSLGVAVAICATGALLGLASNSLATIRGTYSGSGKGFTIRLDVNGAHVTNLNVACGKGAITVAAVGAAPKVKSGSFTYSGPASASNRNKSVHMKVTGTFLDHGKEVRGNASTAGVCQSASYTASK